MGLSQAIESRKLIIIESTAPMDRAVTNVISILPLHRLLFDFYPPQFSIKSTDAQLRVDNSSNTRSDSQLLFERVSYWTFKPVPKTARCSPQLQLKPLYIDREIVKNLLQALNG